MKDKKTNDKIEETPLYEWAFHPAKANLVVTSLVTIFLFLLLVIVFWLTQSRMFTIIGTVVLVASMRSFYFPTEYKLFDDRVEVCYTVSSIKKDWHIYRRVVPERNGIFLSTFVRPNRMENFRGLFIKYGSADSEKIIEIIRSKVKEDASE